MPCVVIVLCISSFKSYFAFLIHRWRGPVFKPAKSVVSNPFYTKGQSGKNKQMYLQVVFPPNQNEESFIEFPDSGVGGASRNVYSYNLPFRIK